MPTSTALLAPPPPESTATTPAETFDERATRGLTQLASLLETEDFARLTASPTDLVMLYRALSEESVLDAVAREHPDVIDHWRWAQMRKRLLEAEGGVLGAQAFADRLDITRQAVNRRRTAGKLISLELARHGYRYPTWQLDDKGVLDGIPQALAAFDDIDDWTRFAWFLNANILLDDRRPLDLLREGDPQPVIEAASRYGQHGGL